MKHTRKILALVLIVMTVLMSLSVITASAANTPVEKVMDVITGTADADKVAIADGTTYGDGFFTIVGSGTIQRWSSSKGVYAIEIAKKSGSSIQFTIPEGAISPKVVISYASTGSSNTSLLNVTKDGVALGENLSVTGTSFVEATFNLEAGTYDIVAPSSDRGTRVDKVIVTYELNLCEHTGGTATCKDLAVCELCGSSYGELLTEHNFVDGKCTVCELPDPSICQHTNMAPATCLLPATCECGYTEGDPLGHDIIVDEAKAPTCTEKGLEAGEHCSRCDYKVEQKEVAALGHTLTFVNTLPTLGESGKTIADCSVCQEHFDYGEVNVMTPGTYVLEADSFAGIAQYSLYDGYVMVVNDVFTCHLSYKYRTDFYEAGKEKTFAEDDYVSAYRMNFGGASAFCNNGAGEEAVRNGGLKNYIQIVTTSTTYITVHWGVGGDNREVGIYDMEGNLLRTTEEKATKNDLVVSENIELPAGAYLIGSAASDGGNWIHKITVEVEAPHECSFSEPTCTEPGKCECGATQGEALGHDMVIDAAKAPTCTEAGLTSGEHCSRCDHAVAQEEIPALGHNFAEGKCDCGAEDPNYVAPQPEAEEEVELNFFQKIIAWFTNLINKIIAIFKK